MYTKFFGLTEKPFNLTPDPRFLYLSMKHREALAHLLFGIKSQSGFVMITGEIGTGKTTLCRSLLRQLDPDTQISFVFNPALSPEDLLRSINEDFGILSTADNIKGLIDELNSYLLQQAAEGNKCVLVIDEAQNLKPDVLEQVRLLSNLETETQKLLQIVLIGQPELGRVLELPELRQLNQRITTRCHLRPLNTSETLQYIAFRIRVAGGRRKVRFTRTAVKEVYKHSKGTPRVINAVCDRALLIGFIQGQREITKGIVKRAGKEIRGEKMEKERRALPWRHLLPNPTVIATVILVFVLIQVFAVFSPLLSPSFSPIAQLPQKTPAEPSGQNPLSGPSRASIVPPLEPDQPSTEPKEQQREGVANAATDNTAAPEPVEVDAREPEPEPETVDPLEGLTAEIAWDAATRAILRAWSLAVVSSYPDPGTIAGLQEFAEQNGLTFTNFSPTLDELLRINLPAYVKLAAKNGELWAGLIGYEDGQVILAGPNEARIPMDRAGFEQRYQSDAVILWRDPEPGTPILETQMYGRFVTALQEQLTELGWRNAGRRGVFGEEMAAVIKQIQAETGLAVDGVVGKQTRMVLNSWLADPVTPALAPADDAPLRQVASDEAAEAGDEQAALREAPRERRHVQTRRGSSTESARSLPRRAITRGPVTAPAVANTPLVPHGGSRQGEYLGE